MITNYDPAAGAARVAAWRASRILLIGQAPGPTGPPPGRPLVGGRSGAKLQQLTGCATLKEYIKRFETANLLPKYPGRGPGSKGDRFPMVEARHHAALLRKTLAGRTVIFVGLAVAEAFDWVSPVPPFQWRLFAAGDHHAFEPPQFKGAAIPHVSGIVSFWNEPGNVERARRFFDEALNRETA